MGTSKTAEEILELFRTHSCYAGEVGNRATVLPEDEWLHIANNLSQSLSTQPDEELKLIVQGLKFAWDKISEMRKTYAGLGGIEHGIKHAYYFLKDKTSFPASVPVTEDEIEKMAERYSEVQNGDPRKYSDVYQHQCYESSKEDFIAGYKAAHQEKDGENCVASQSTTSEPVASHTCTVGNSIEQGERILCSAIWFDDGKEYTHQPKNVKTGFVIAGRRHHNCYSTLQAIGSSLGLEGIVRNHIEKIDRDKQGFITNLNRYVDRKEGFQIALKAGQLIAPELHSHQENPILTSEDLW